MHKSTVIYYYNSPVGLTVGFNWSFNLPIQWSAASDLSTERHWRVAGKSRVTVSVGQPKLIKIIEIRSTSYYRDDVAFVFHFIGKTFLLDCTTQLFHHGREYYLSAFLYIYNQLL